MKEQGLHQPCPSPARISTSRRPSLSANDHSSVAPQLYGHSIETDSRRGVPLPATGCSCVHQSSWGPQRELGTHVQGAPEAPWSHGAVLCLETL